MGCAAGQAGAVPESEATEAEAVGTATAAVVEAEAEAGKRRCVRMPQATRMKCH